MATTTNYGWTTPDDTALVKDGASAIRTLGTSVDTTTKNLNPETTLGDLAYRSSTANVKTRLALGTANQVLAVNSGATAPEWKTLGASGATLISTTNISAAATTTVDSLFSDTYKAYILQLSYKVSSNGNQLVLKYRYATTTHSANYFYTSTTGNTTGGTPTNDLYGSSVSAITLPGVASADYSYFTSFISKPETTTKLQGNYQHNDMNYNNTTSSGGWRVNSSQNWGGLEITATAGTITGVLSVYGLAN
jgi:hypothetical protein